MREEIQKPVSITYKIIFFAFFLATVITFATLKYVESSSSYDSPIIISYLTTILILLVLGSVSLAGYYFMRMTSRIVRFQDVDIKREDRNEFYRSELHRLKNEVKKQESVASNIEIKIEEAQAKYDANVQKEFKETYSSFENYFNKIILVITDQIVVSDEKASILLDKGISYIRIGILFYLSSIILWQWLSIQTEFKTIYIYGIVSCSLLFIFIEFIAAWFLKQYRHFVDTSSYLIKVKSIFDKYMLTYLYVKNQDFDNQDNQKELILSMVDLLKKDITWPSEFAYKDSNDAFMKEAMSSIADLSESIKAVKTK